MNFAVLILWWLPAILHAEPWNELSDPTNLNSNYDYAFQNLPLNGAVDESKIPWSDNYWESDWGGISLRWRELSEAQLDPDVREEGVDPYVLFEYTPPNRSRVLSMTRAELANLSPAEKYDILMGRYDYPTVRAERERTSPDQEYWEGLCHGWVPAAINHPEPKPIDVRNADGVNVPFGTSDLKGLLSYYYGVPAYDYARGNRNVVRNGNTLQYLDQLDAFDLRKWISLATDVAVFNDRGYRVNVESLKDGVNCQNADYASQYGGLEACLDAQSISANVEAFDRIGQIGRTRVLADPNAGAFHVVMANQLGLLRKSFAENINKKPKNMEIWNQPVVEYSSRILSDQRDRNGAGLVEVQTKLTFVVEISQNWDQVVHTSKQRFDDMTFSYTLEINSAGKITGGYWKSRTYHPNFLWKHEPIPIKGYFARLNEIYRS